MELVCQCSRNGLPTDGRGSYYQWVAAGRTTKYRYSNKGIPAEGWPASHQATMR